MPNSQWITKGNLTKTGTHKEGSIKQFLKKKSPQRNKRKYFQSPQEFMILTQHDNNAMQNIEYN